jgi:ribosome recycling factor
MVLTMNNGDVIIISVPALTEERRRDLAKQTKVEAEDAKVGIKMRVKMPIQKLKNLKRRNIEDICKTAEDEVQPTLSSKIDELCGEKAEIMKVKTINTYLKPSR